jgi:hypothetical protein
MMANLLGATSAGNAVKINYNMALDAYHQFLRGHYDEAIKLYNQAYDIKQSGKGALMKHITDNGIHEALGEEAPKTDERAMEQWIAHHNLTPRSANGKLFGHNSIQVLKVLAQGAKFHPSVPELEARLKGAGGVLHMQGGGLVDDPDPDPATGPLANARDVYTQEMANNPDVRQRLINRTYAEVGDQSPQAWQAYIESSMNRGVARNQTLDYTISPQSRYFPSKTAFPKPAPKDFATQVQPYIDQALAGSNLSNLATGNQSGDVKSGGAPITFDPKVGTLGDEAYIRQLGLPKLDYETFVLEKNKADQKWAAEMSRQQANPLPVAQAVNKMGGYGPENQPPPPPPAPASVWYPQQAPIAPPSTPAVAPPVSPFGFRAPPVPPPEE